jgi:hypothetical protein
VPIAAAAVALTVTFVSMFHEHTASLAKIASIFLARFASILALQGFCQQGLVISTSAAWPTQQQRQ